MSGSLLLLWSLVGCAPGTLVFPGGAAEVRTAHWRVDRDDGAPVLRVFASNSEVPCSFPGGQGAAFGDALQALQLGLCREGAHHVGLTLYQQADGTWEGGWPARPGAHAGALDDAAPRLASGAYAGVDEAFLVQVDGLDRWYAPAEETFVPDLGVGRVDVHGVDPRLDLSFAFDEAGVFGELRAATCEVHDGLLELLADDPLLLCP